MRRLPAPGGLLCRKQSAMVSTEKRPAVLIAISGLTTALSIAQGGTGQTNAQAFLTNAGMINTYNSFTLPFTDRNMRVVVDSVVTTTNVSGEGTVNYPNTFANVCIACIPVIVDQSGISIMVINYSGCWLSQTFNLFNYSSPNRL